MSTIREAELRGWFIARSGLTTLNVAAIAIAPSYHRSRKNVPTRAIRNQPAGRIDLGCRSVLALSRIKWKRTTQGETVMGKITGPWGTSKNEESIRSGYEAAEGGVNDI